VAELSHDLRSPLASLRLLVEGMSDGVLGAQQRLEYLSQMETQISLLTAMIDDLHSLSRLEAGDPAGAFEAVDPGELVERAVQATRIQARAARVGLEIDAPPFLPNICANPLHLHRVLVNLIENAIRHTDEGGSVSVRAHPTPGSLVIEIEDDGDCIPAEDTERVFTAFYGGDRKRSAGRSGLGLAMARATIEAHGGKICVAASSRGTRLRISLPASPVLPARATAAPNARQARDLERVPSRPNRVRRRHSHARAGQF
jgi:signal transduction histidine kinase